MAPKPPNIGKVFVPDPDAYYDLGELIYDQWNAGYACRSIKEMIKDWLEKKHIDISQVDPAMQYIDQLQEFTEARGRSGSGPKFISRHELENLGLYIPDTLIGDRDDQAIFDPSKPNRPVIVLRHLPSQYQSWDEIIDEVNNKLDDEYMLSSHNEDTFTLIRIKGIN